MLGWGPRERRLALVQTLLFPPDPMDYDPPDKIVHPGYRKIPSPSTT